MVGLPLTLYNFIRSVFRSKIRAQTVIKIQCVHVEKWLRIIVSATQVVCIIQIGLVQIHSVMPLFPFWPFDNLTLILFIGVDVVLVKSPHI